MITTNTARETIELARVIAAAKDTGLSTGIRMVVLDLRDTPHEFEQDEENGEPFGYCPANSARTAYRSAKAIITLNP